jgi:hypothetical protein
MKIKMSPAENEHLIISTGKDIQILQTRYLEWVVGGPEGPV